FYEAFNPDKKNDLSRYYSFILSVLIFALVLFVSWEFFRHILLGRIEKGGLLFDESGETKLKEDAQEKEFYELQDDLQAKISSYIPDLEYKEDRHQVLYMVSSLIKDSPDVMELRKAEKGLIDKFKRPGHGLEPAESESMTILLDNYVNKKIELNSRKARSNIVSDLKSNPFKIEERMAISERVNRMQESSSSLELRDNERETSKAIESSFVKPKVKKEMEGLVQKIKELKALGLYRQQMDDFNKKVSSLEGRAGEEFKKLSSAIENAQSLSDLREVENNLENAKEAYAGEHKDLIKQGEDITRLKSELLLSGESRNAKAKLDNSSLSKTEAQELKEKIDELKASQGPEDFSESALKLEEKAIESGADILNEIGGLMGMKMHNFIREGKEKIKELLKQGVIPDAGDEVIKNIEKIESRKENERLDSDLEGLKGLLDKYYKQGFISEDTKDKLAAEIEGLGKLFSLKLKIEQQTKDKEAPALKRRGNYQQGLKDLIDNSSLKENQKEDLKQLADSLFNAQNISQIENIKDGMSRELNNYLKKGANKEEVKSIRESFEGAAEAQRMLLIDKAFSQMREKANNLENTDPQAAQKLKEQIEKIRDTSTSEEFQKELDALKAYLSLESQKKGSGSESKEAKDELIKEIELVNKAMQSAINEGQQMLKQKSKADLQKEIEQMINESSFKPDKKENLKKISEDLSKADSLTKLKDAQDKLARQTEALLKEGANKEELDKLNAKFQALAKMQKASIVDKELSSLKEKIEKLDKISPQAAQKLKEQLKNIQSSSSEQELKKVMDKIEEAGLNMQAEQEKLKQLEQDNKSPWQIYILPSQLVLGAGSTAKLKAIAVYNKSFTKELISELEWSSSNPQAVEVDQKGTISAFSEGRSKITAVYKGRASSPVQVIVVGKTDPETEGAVKKELTLN
ncbi:MAG: hypothetical protein FJZ08_03625, partial [Candidatus Omnitrophica bacterium]|nr:hypothetical protein [Candidatus Omnitrophota bacterium]